MSIELLKTISTICFVVGGIALCVAGVLCFVLQIPKAIGYLTGFTARKRISQILEHSFGRTEPLTRQTKRPPQTYRPGAKHKTGGTAARTGEGFPKTGDTAPKAEKLAQNTGDAYQKTSVLQTQEAEASPPEIRTSVLNEPPAAEKFTSLLRETDEPEVTEVLPIERLQVTAELPSERFDGFAVETDLQYLASNEIIE